MKFGKFDDITTANFALPPNDTAWNTAALAAAPRLQVPQIYIGCTGWSMKEWEGKIYPQGTKTKDYLALYSQQFDSIELNTTHYRTPDPTTIATWRSNTPHGFRFAPKVLQGISHSRDLGAHDGYAMMHHFADTLLGLGEKLGPTFLQLPPTFTADKLPILADFLAVFAEKLPLAIEVRHESWFEDAANFAALSELLQQHNTVFVMTDVAGRRDVLHSRLTAPVAMLRFVGNGLHPTDYTRADAWVTRISDWVAQGLHELYLFAHEPDNLLALEMGQYFAQAIAQKIPNVIVQLPVFITDVATAKPQLALF
jgi:uncharacterized protein YecE (DUF72 family)